MNEFLINILNNKIINHKIYENSELIDNPIFLNEKILKNNLISHTAKTAFDLFEMKVGTNLSYSDTTFDIKVIHLIDEDGKYTISKNFDFAFILELLYLIAKEDYDFKDELNYSEVENKFNNIKKPISNNKFDVSMNRLQKYGLIELSQDKKRFIFSFYLMDLFDKKHQEILNKNL